MSILLLITCLTTLNAYAQNDPAEIGTIAGVQDANGLIDDGLDYGLCVIATYSAPFSVINPGSNVVLFTTWRPEFNTTQSGNCLQGSSLSFFYIQQVSNQYISELDMRLAVATDPDEIAFLNGLHQGFIGQMWARGFPVG